MRQLGASESASRTTVVRRPDFAAAAKCGGDRRREDGFLHRVHFGGGYVGETKQVLAVTTNDRST
jgi:hypothetical protein